MTPTPILFLAAAPCSRFVLFCFFFRLLGQENAKHHVLLLTGWDESFVKVCHSWGTAKPSRTSAPGVLDRFCRVLSVEAVRCRSDTRVLSCTTLDPPCAPKLPD